MIEIHLSSGHLMPFIFSDRKWNSYNLLDGSLMKLCQSHGSLVLSATFFLFPFPLCPLMVSFTLSARKLSHTTSTLSQLCSWLTKNGINTFPLYSENVADVPNGKAWLEAAPSKTLTSCVVGGSNDGPRA